jgi:hypothetical protein
VFNLVVSLFPSEQLTSWGKTLWRVVAVWVKHWNCKQEGPSSNPGVTRFFFFSPMWHPNSVWEFSQTARWVTCAWSVLGQNKCFIHIHMEQVRTHPVGQIWLTLRVRTRSLLARIQYSTKCDPFKWITWKKSWVTPGFELKPSCLQF